MEDGTNGGYIIHPELWHNFAPHCTKPARHVRKRGELSLPRRIGRDRMESRVSVSPAIITLIDRQPNVEQRTQGESTMKKKRPFVVTILAFLAGLAAVVAIAHTLQMLHLLPISGPFGQASFFTFDIWGAFMWGILALIYIWLVRMLWNLDPGAWVFLVVLSALNLIMAVMSIFGQSSWQAMLPALIVNGIILLYCLMPGTKDAFSIEQVQK